jgi:hypothetical protein
VTDQEIKNLADAINKMLERSERLAAEQEQKKLERRLRRQQKAKALPTNDTDLVDGVTPTLIAEVCD